MLRMSGLARDGTAEPVSRDDIFRRANGNRKKKKKLPVQLTASRVGCQPYPVDA